MIKTASTTLAIVLCMLPGAASARLVELTFDDGKAGTGVATGDAELNNMEATRGAVGVEPSTTALVGNAVRSAITAGRYGRAAEFPDGGGYIEIKNLPWVGQTPTIYAWIKAKDLSKGTLLEAVGLFKVLLDQGTVYVEAARSSGPAERSSIGAFPTDGAFHHLTIEIDRRGATPKFTLTIDTTVLGTASTTLIAPGGAGAPELHLGDGFSGWIDELLINDTSPGPGDLFDRLPANCPSGLTCKEEVITVTPTDFPHEVPVRFKVAYDPATCTAASPCTLLFDVSGGNDCSDDYQAPGTVARFASEGFLVVTPDAYCEAGMRTSPYPTETSQYIAVKEHLRSTSTVKTLIKAGDYFASGCSHGASLVTVWSLHESDHPSRIYARSPATDTLCVFANKIACPAVHAEREQRIIAQLGSVDFEHATMKATHLRGASADLITPVIAQSRELAISWGINLTGPVCTADGNYACNEEGLWGMNWGARRFRDVWRAREPQGAPTGYFVEDHGADCRHCASIDSQAFGCGMCLLKHGRAGMAQNCSSCLDHSAPDIGPGAAAEQCTLKASWYSDPLANEASDGGALDGGAADGGTPDGAAADAGTGAPSNNGGCCSTVSNDAGTPLSALLLLLALLAPLAAARHRRRG